MAVRFLLNGTPVELEDFDPLTTLLDWLRARGLTGTKEGCNEGDCGACTVTVSSTEDGPQAMNACILLLPQLHGRAVRTVEGIGHGAELHPVQAAMVECHGSQCGFCTPGIVMSLFTAHAQGRGDHDDVLAGNLCRCTGYAPIIRAAEDAATAAPSPVEDADALAALEAEAGALSMDGAFVPDDLDAFAAWYTQNPQATLIGGATDVGLWVTKALRRPLPVAFLHRLAALRRVEITDDGISLGAGVTMARLRGLMAGRHPDFAELIRRFGSVQVRASATLGGNIANGSPIGDAAPALIALGAQLTLRKGSARRTIALEDFFIAYGKQDRAPGEFVERVFVPAQPDLLRCHKISKRFDQDISAICGAFNIEVADGRVVAARIAFGGMAATPKRAGAVEAALIGTPWTEEGVQSALPAFAEDFQPISDMRAGAAYRLRVARNLLVRTFRERQGDHSRLAGWTPAA